jgi:hypothetical protein
MSAVCETNLISLARAARMIPGRGGRGVHASTVFRWAQRGLKVGDQRVRLETVKVGGIRATTRDALERFIARLNASPGASSNAESEQKQDNRCAKAAEKYLDEIGIV